MNADPAAEAPSSRERHSRKCTICTHPDREAIDEAFLHWSRNDRIVIDFSLPSLSSLYRHAHACVLWNQRRSNIRFALDRIIEKAGEAKPNAYAVLRAIEISCRFDKHGAYVEPTKRTIIEHRTVNAESISNRIALRLDTPVTPVTPTKQKPATSPRSNSNREALRLETDLTPTKQKPDTTSNRENNPPFQDPPAPPVRADDSARRKILSNREALRSETAVTPTE